MKIPLIAGHYDPRYLDVLRAVGNGFAAAWTLDQAVIGVQVGQNLPIRLNLAYPSGNFHASSL